MLSIKTGPFHPHLERTLVEDLRRLRQVDPFGPVAVVVPSAHLLSRMRELLVLDAKLPLLNVHFLTFHQLALRLRQERDGMARDATARPETAAVDRPPRLDLVEDFFFQSLLDQITRRDVADISVLRPAAASPGGQAALWATIRDLKDAAVDPAVASRAIAEGLFEPEDTPKLQALFAVYAAVLEASRMLEVGGIDDLASSLTRWVSESRFLRGLRRVWYYGFYDLTQVQLAFFEAVTRSAPVTLFFPLDEEEPAYNFARRFLERHLLPLLPASEKVVRAEAPVSLEDLPGHHPDVQILSAVGPEDELTLVCKEILSLVETHGYRHDEIGVVARGLQPYQAFLRRAFDEHRIPFTSTAVAPVITQPAAKAFLQLACLPQTRFTRRAVLDLLASPVYRFDLSAGDLQGLRKVRPRPDLWLLAVEELGIRGGEADWQRLGTVGSLDAAAGGSDDETDKTISIPLSQLRLLWHLVARLIRDCQALPREGTMAELTDAFVLLASRHLQLPQLGEEEERGVHTDGPGAALRHALDQLRQVDDLLGSVSWQHWAGVLTHLIEQTVMPIEPLDVAGGHAGVRVLDAMAARGVPFRALFVLGLNEKVFPRFIREDAFLRDRQRRVLDETLGYKIDEKLIGYDEEQLLFALLRKACGRRLYLSYQRADTDGRPLAPSPYLPQSDRLVHLPRRFSDRTGLPHFARMLLTREELTLRLLLDGQDPSELLGAMDREPSVFQQGLEALRGLEGSSNELGPYDGIAGPLHGQWEQLISRGVAPTSLEDYARCPTRYFAKHVLRLDPVRQPLTDGLPPHAWGTLAHRSLRACHERLIKLDWPATAMNPTSLREQAVSAVEEACSEYAAGHGTGHALLWDMAKETLAALIAITLELDQQDYQADGYRPVAFEVEAEGLLDGLGPGFESVKVRGRLDRVDQRSSPVGIRVVDYKFKLGRRMSSVDRDLQTSALRGFRLQPPLYAVMQTAQGQGGTGSVPTERVEFRFLAPNWETVVDRSEFAAAILSTPDGQRLKGTLKTLLHELRAGSYVMLPAEDYCDYCEFSAACRRFHGPSWWRAYRASASRLLRSLRKQKLQSPKTQARQNGTTTGG